MGFGKLLTYVLLLFGGLLLVAFDYFLVTPIKASAAVLQLKDSNVLYSIGEKAATSNVSTIIFIIGLIMIAISSYKLLTGRKKIEKSN